MIQLKNIFQIYMKSRSWKTFQIKQCVKNIFLPKNGLFVQAMVFVGSPLQPYKQWDPEAPESDGYAESGADDDGLIHDSNDFEQESEEDEWFDQFIKGASEESIAPTELDPATPKPPAPAVANKDKDKKVPCIRPVARPLCHAGQSGGSDVQMIEDSPVKLEVVVDPDEQVHREKEEKAKKMEAPGTKPQTALSQGKTIQNFRDLGILHTNPRVPKQSSTGQLPLSFHNLVSSGMF